MPKSEVERRIDRPYTARVASGGPSNGTPGPQGEPGLSAYEVAVANGFVGDEAAWLDSLVGEQGPEGPQGEQGPQGEPGDAADIVTEVDAATELTTPGGSERFALTLSGVLRWISYTNLRNAVKSYYDSVSATLTNKTIDASNNILTNVGTSSLSNGAVTNSKLANMVAHTIKANNSGSSGSPSDVDASTWLTQYGDSRYININGSSVITGDMGEYRLTEELPSILATQAIRVDVTNANGRMYYTTFEIYGSRGGVTVTRLFLQGWVAWNGLGAGATPVIRAGEFNYDFPGTPNVTITAIANGIRLSIASSNFGNTITNTMAMVRNCGDNVSSTNITISVV